MHLSNLQYLNNQIDTNQKKQDRVFLSSPHMSDEGYEMQFIQEAFDTNWIAPLGENVDEFEKELAKKVGSQVCSCTIFWYSSYSYGIKSS